MNRTSSAAAKTLAGIVHVIGSLEQGGSERQALQLLRLLKRTGSYRLFLVTVRRGGALWDEAEADFGPLHVFPVTSFVNMNAWVQVMRFASFLRRERISIVQTHEFYSNVFGMVGAAIAGVPARIAARREISGVRTAAQARVQHAAYRLADVVVVNAAAVKQQLSSERVPERKIDVVYNGVDPARLAVSIVQPRAATLRQLGIPEAGDRRRYVTIVANMHFPVKNHETFLRAAELVATAVPDAAFVIAGEGALQSSLERLVTQLGLTGRVHFIGRCSSIAELLSISDVCVLSSRAEGFPNVVLEYMASGRPVVATDVGGVREAVADGETGYLVPPGDAHLMAGRITGLLRDVTLSTGMGERGRRVVLETFSCEAQLARTEAIYNRLLSRKAVARFSRAPDGARAPATPARTTNRE